MKSTKGWMVKFAGTALVALTMMACGENTVPPTGVTGPVAKAPGATITAPGDVNKSVDPCPGGVCDGGGGGGGTPSNTIQLTWFEDQPGGPTHNYYELRQGVYNSAGTGVGYAPFRIHGDSYVTHEFTTLNTGVSMPCGGHLHLQLWQGTWGATVWNFVGDVDVNWNENGANHLFYNYATGAMALVRYQWISCV